MSPDTFQDLLDRATDGAPPAPLPWAALDAGHQRLRTRRRRVAAAASAAFAVLAVGTSLVVLLPGDAPESHAPVTEPTTKAQILERCLSATPARGETALKASGTPTLEVSVRTDLKIVAAVASADGTLWGQCWIWLQPQASTERSAGMQLFEAQPSAGGLSGGWSIGTGCGVPETEKQSCDRWSVSGTDQLPPAVAAVQFDLGDGTTETVRTRDGFYVLNVLHSLPPGGRVNRHGAVMGFDFATQMTYLAADGTPLAAARLDALTNGGDTEVPGLPPLTDYPSIGRPWVP